MPDHLTDRTSRSHQDSNNDSKIKKITSGDNTTVLLSLS